MKLAIKSREDFLSGLLFVVIGVVALVIAYNYPRGTMARMGPGMLPLMLGSLLALIGGGVCLQSLALKKEDKILPESVAAETEAIAGWRLFRPLAGVALGMGAFALLVRPLGLILAVVALVLIVTQAERGFPLWLTLIMAPILAGAVVGIFVYGLGLPFPVWF
jgi:hypothetical protein